MRRRDFLLMGVSTLALMACGRAKDARAAVPESTIWNPLQFGASLVAWGDMTDASTVTVAGGNVMQVTDRSGNGWTASANGTPPIYQPTLFNGHPCAQFAFKDCSLETSTALALVQPNTVFCLFRTGESVDPSGIVWDGNVSETGSRQLLFAGDSTLGNQAALFASTSVPVAPKLSASSYIISVAQLNGPYTSHSINGAPPVIVDPGTAGISNGFKLGGLNAKGNELNLAVCIWGIVNRNLTYYEKQKLEGYLVWSVGLQSLLPPGHPYYGAPPLANDTTQTVSTFPGIYGGKVHPAAPSLNLQAFSPFNFQTGGVYGSGVRCYGNGCCGVITISVAQSGYYLLSVGAGLIKASTGSPNAGLMTFQLDGIYLDACNGRGIPTGAFTQSCTTQDQTASQPFYWRAALTEGTHLLTFNFRSDASELYVVASNLITLLSAGLPKEPFGKRDPTVYPLSAYHLYNTPIGSKAVWSSSTDADTRTLNALGGAINSTRFSWNLYTGKSSDIVRQWQNTDGGIDPCNASSVHMPQNMGPSASDPNDLGMALNDETQTRWLWGGFGTSVNQNPVGPGVTQGRSTIYDNYNGWNNGQSQGQGGPGLIRAQEVLSGAINHMLMVGLPESAVRTIPTQFTGLAWPAAEADYNGPGGYTGNIQYGATIGIPRTVNLASLGLTQGGLILAICLQNYGGTVQITGGSGILLYHEGTILSDSMLFNGMIYDWYSNPRHIISFLRIMRNQGPNSINGGGAPIVPTLPGVGVLTG